MAWEYPILNLPGQTAGAAFDGTGTTHGYQSTGQFLFTKLSADDTHIPCSAVTDLPVGVSQTNPKSGDALAVMALGVTKIVAGGTITAGDLVGTDANGAAVTKAPTSTGANYGQYVRGVALEGAASGELATVLLIAPFLIH